MGCTANKSSTVSAEVEQKGTVEDFHDKYLLGAKLGRGAFAQVRLATSVNKEQQQQGKVKAVKILDLRGKSKDGGSLQPSKTLQKAARNEAMVWAVVATHKNTVRLFDVFYSEELCYMVMEKCSASLYHYLTESPEVNERSLGKIFAQMLTGIEHVHSAKVVHRDVKPDNFLVGGEDGHTIKIADFGLSARLQKEGKSYGKLTGVYGTAPFMCPEMLMGQGYGEVSDVWSFAVIVYALLLGNFPYVPKEASSASMKQAIVQGNTPSFEPDRRTGNKPKISLTAVNFVRELLDRDPEKRMTATEALQMNFMVAIADSRHAVGENLPSLRSTLHAAKKIGAFEVRDPCRASPLDATLEELHMAKHGTHLPDNHSQNMEKIKTPQKRSQHRLGENLSRNSSELSGSVSNSTTTGSQSSCPFGKGSGWSKSMQSSTVSSGKSPSFIV